MKNSISSDIFTVDSQLRKVETGSLLVSEPFAADRYFSRSVILITEYNQEGAIGFVLNKPLYKNLHSFVSVSEDIKAPVYLGGPVSKDRIFFIHTLGEKIPGSIHIKGGIYWGGDFELITMMLENKQISMENLRFFTGYAGWMPNQLDGELENNFWLVNKPRNMKKLLKYEPKIWERITYDTGDKYKFWSHVPVNPKLN